MKKSTVLLSLIVLALIISMCSCGSTGNDDVTGTDATTAADSITTDTTEPSTDNTETTDTTTGTEAEVSKGTDTESGTGTEAETTAAETEMPRLDYFEEDMDKYLTIGSDVYNDIKITLSSEYVISDKNVQDYITSVRVGNATARDGEDKTTDKPIELGDVVSFYYKGTIDGVAFEGGSYLPADSSTPATLAIGSGRMIPGFEDAMIGLIPNQSSEENMIDINVTFPQVYKSEDLRGKAAVFSLYIVSVAKMDVPEYTDAFITDVAKYTPIKESYADGELKAEYEQYIKEYLVGNMKSTVDNAKAGKIWEYLRASATLKELPQIEVDYYYKSYMDQFEYYFNYYNTAYGYKMYDSIDDFAVDYMQLEKGADWKAELTKTCRELVMENLIYHAIAENENMEKVTNEEFNDQLEYYVEYYSASDAATLRAQMGDTYINEAALYEKILTFIDGKVTVTYD